MSLYRLSQLTPREFELEVKSNLDALSGGLTDYQSAHREVLEGMDGEYEIDITVRFTAFGGASFLTLVECKHYKKPVEREKVQALFSKLQSVGAHKGMIFSTSGFQSGACEFAEAHGIALVELLDGRACYFIRNSADRNLPLPWSQVPPGLPRIIGWLLNGNLMSIVSPEHPESLRAFLESTPVEHAP